MAGMEIVLNGSPRPVPAGCSVAGLLREALEELLPEDLGRWTEEAHRQRVRWKEDGVPLAARRGLLLEALNGLYAAREVHS